MYTNQKRKQFAQQAKIFKKQLKQLEKRVTTCRSGASSHAPAQVFSFKKFKRINTCLYCSQEISKEESEYITIKSLTRIYEDGAKGNYIGI